MIKRLNISSEEIRNVFLTLNRDTLIEIISLIVQWIFYTALCHAIDVFGICTNIINLVIFCKHGFKDTVNISLLGLAISDIGCVSTLLWSNLCLNPAFRRIELPFDPTDVSYLTTGIPHTVFTRISCWITAFITMERCLCIAAPLKVKTILTSKRVKVIIVSVFVIFISTTAPVYVANKLDIKFFPERNKTLLGLVYRENRDELESGSFIINNIVLPFAAFIIIVVCTVTLVYKLRNTTKWRMKSTSARGGNVSSQNQKVAKMVVMISTLFIGCFTPECFIFVGFLLEPELFIGGVYEDILIILSGLGMLLESINSSMNVFIYYNMSSKYRTVFRQILFFKR